MVYQGKYTDSLLTVYKSIIVKMNTHNYCNEEYILYH